MEKKLNRKVPAIRFKGFDGEWYETALSSFSDIKTGPFGSTLHAEDYVDNGIPIVTTEHFKSWQLPLSKYGVPQVSEKDYIRLSSYVLKREDLVFSRVGSIDINARVGNEQEGWLFSGRVLRVRINADCDSEYLHHELSTWRVRKGIESRAVGQTMPSINTGILGDTIVYLPECRIEQTKIGHYFKTLDQALTLHQHKHNKLITLKQAMLQKMFPQKGAATPEVRFKGFEGSWEERKISDICGVTSGGGTPKTSEANFWSGNIPWIQSSDISESNIYSVVPRKWINKEAIRKSATKLVSANSIAVVTRVGVGKLALVEFDYATSQDFLSLSKLNIDKHFAVVSVYLVLKSKMNETQGTSIKGLTKEELLDYKILIPEDKSEQQKIGNYFQKLDQLIEQHATQLEKLKQIKAACLERMFV